MVATHAAAPPEDTAAPQDAAAARRAAAAPLVFQAVGVVVLLSLFPLPLILTVIPLGALYMASTVPNNPIIPSLLARVSRHEHAFTFVVLACVTFLCGFATGEWMSSSGSAPTTTRAALAAAARRRAAGEAPAEVPVVSAPHSSSSPLEMLFIVGVFWAALVAGRWPEVFRWLSNNLPGGAAAQFRRVVSAIGLRPAHQTGSSPTAQHAIDALTCITVTPDHVSTLSQACAVCLDDYVVGDKVNRLPCGHLFHPHCVLPWLRQHNSCPTCRFELESDEALPAGIPVSVPTATPTIRRRPNLYARYRMFSRTPIVSLDGSA